MKKLLFGVAVVLAGCVGGDGPTPPKDPDVATVLVTAPSNALVVGGTVQATATPLPAGGQALTGKTVQWSSGTPAVASVNNSGLITAVTAGSAVIRAAVGAVVGELNVTVDVNRCLSPLSMQPGEVKLLSGPDAVAC